MTSDTTFTFSPPGEPQAPRDEPPVFDLDVLVPVSAQGKYAERLKTFKRFGILNAAGLKIRLTLLVGDENPELFQEGWDFPIRLKTGRTREAAPRIYDYYAAMTDDEARGARWFVRVDDDSVTDVGGLVEWLDANYDWRECHYLMTKACFDVHPVYGEGALRLGYGRLFRPYMNGKPAGLNVGCFAHEWECALLSQAMMRRIMEHEHCRALFAYCARFDGGYGDHVLAVAARMTGFTPAESEVLCCEAEVEKLSLWGGDFFHIHYIAPDLERWPDFLNALEKHDFSVVPAPDGAGEHHSHD